MIPTENSELNTEQLAHFEREGYVILRGVLEPQVVAEAREAIAEMVEAVAHERAALQKSALHADAPFETRYLEIFREHPADVPFGFRPELHKAGMFGLFFHPRILHAAEQILGPELRLYPNYTVRPKLPDHAGTLVPWHQDSGFTEAHHKADDAEGSADDLRMVNLWTAFVPATRENGCMQFVPGSHTSGTVGHEDKGRYIEIEERFLAPVQDKIIDVELDPGDVVMFSNLLFHRGQPNVSKTIRWSCDWRYQDATQPTLRPETGHLARSQAHPEKVIHHAAQWAQESFK